MAPRPAWKGYLKLSLVTCAVELSGALIAGAGVYGLCQIVDRQPARRQSEGIYFDAHGGLASEDIDTRDARQSCQSLADQRVAVIVQFSCG